MRRLCISLLFVVAGCGESVSGTDAGPPADASVQDVGGATDAGSETDAGVSPAPEGLSLLSRLAGMWTGAATRTVLGDFPLMTFDMRAIDEHTLFGRSDLTEQDSLRFMFNVETHEGRDVLIYRNGGYFRGFLRDSRTQLESYDEAGQSWRFCHVERGCDYIDAVFDFEAEDELVFDVWVKGQQHVFWNAVRVETRAVPEPFPKDSSTRGDGSAPFPDLPKLVVTVGWPTPLAADADVWVLLSAERCGLTFDCTPSRSIRVPATSGATSVTAEIDQIHAGDYFGFALLDRNQNFETVLFPDSGDGVSIPDKEMTVAPGTDNQGQITIVRDF